MWYEVENGSAARPAEVDSTSSRVYVYVRRNFELVQATEESPAHYRWEECKIPKEVWPAYQQTANEQTVIGGQRTERLYEPGELIAVGGTLYRVTLPIPAGGYIAPGTNVQATSIVDEIIRLK